MVALSGSTSSSLCQAHLSRKQALSRSRHFGMPQSRSRIYILMIKKELADIGQVRGLLHLVTNVLPATMKESTVDDARRYVHEVTSLLGTGLSIPPFSKDWAGVGGASSPSSIRPLLEGVGRVEFVLLVVLAPGHSIPWSGGSKKSRGWGSGGPHLAPSMEIWGGGGRGWRQERPEAVVCPQCHSILMVATISKSPGTISKLPGTIYKSRKENCLIPQPTPGPPTSPKSGKPRNWSKPKSTTPLPSLVVFAGGGSRVVVEVVICGPPQKPVRDYLVAGWQNVPEIQRRGCLLFQNLGHPTWPWLFIDLATWSSRESAREAHPGYPRRANSSNQAAQSATGAWISILQEKHLVPADPATPLSLSIV